MAKYPVVLVWTKVGDRLIQHVVCYMFLMTVIKIYTIPTIPNKTKFINVSQSGDAEVFVFIHCY